MLIRKPFYFLRHGQTDWNVAKRIQGQTDIPLNDRGREQARLAGKKISTLDISAIYASQLSRAYETAELVKPHHSTPISIVEDLKEVTIGERDGHPSGDWYLQWKSGNLEITGAETRVAFRKRVLKGINYVLNQENTPLIVSHGGVFGALKESVDMLPEIAITNCMLLHIKPDELDENNWLIDVLFEVD